jgi:hypothetical protein
MDDDIPPLRRPEDMPPIRTQADLHRHWRALMGALGFGKRTLWVQMIGPDDRGLPALLQFDHIPGHPDAEFLAHLMKICSDVLVELPTGSRVAMLLSRPGRRELTTSDRIWAARLHRAAALGAVRCAALHLANDHEVRVITPDDFARSASA